MSGYEPSVVAFLRNGSPVGLGLLVGDRQVVTAAHVVNAALGRPLRDQGQPSTADVVQVQFPLVHGAPERLGMVSAWSPPFAAGVGRADVAGLILDQDAPAGVPRARFSAQRVVPGSVLRVFGFPGDPPRPQGVWVDVKFMGVVAGGLAQVESLHAQSVKAQPGFSGSPVWRDDTGETVGLLDATADPDEPARDAYLLPPGVLASTWKEQLGHVVAPPQAEPDGLALAAVVRPRLLDFGSVDVTYWLEGVISSDEPIVGVDADPTMWQVEQLTDYRAVLGMCGLVPGEWRSDIEVRMSSGSATVQVKAVIAASDESGWPRPPTTSAARELVEAAVARRLFGSRRPVSGPLEVRPLHVIRVAVESVMESISRQSVRTPTNPTSPIGRARLDVLKGRMDVLKGRLDDLAQPIGWGDVAYERLLSRPVKVTCDSCDDRHTKLCPKCNGKGWQPCFVHRNECVMCLGGGLVGKDNRRLSMFSRDDEPRFTCPRCAGTGRGTCERCGGSGRLKCPECRKGRVPCDDCAGTGRLFRYTLGRIDHTVRVARYMTHSEEGLGLAQAKAPWRPLHAGILDSDICECPGSKEMQDWLDEQVGAWDSRAIARRVHSEILPIFAVDYVQGERERTLYLVGDGQALRVRKPAFWTGIGYREEWLAGT